MKLKIRSLLLLTLTLSLVTVSGVFAQRSRRTTEPEPRSPKITTVSTQGVILTGRLKSGDVTVPVHLMNSAMGIDIPIKLNADRSFKVEIPVLSKGFYSLGDEIKNLYLEPGFNLQMEPATDERYHFAGKGSKENNLLTDVADRTDHLLPLDANGTLFWSAVNLPLDSMVTMLNTYKEAVSHQISRSDNPFFKKMEIENSESYSRNLLGYFTKNYGIDSVVVKDIEGLSKDHYLETPQDIFMQELILGKALRKNWLTDQQKQDLNVLAQKDFDWNNVDLFYNSAQYRSELSDKITAMVDMSQTHKFARSSAGLYLACLSLTEKTVSNPVIKDQLKATFGYGIMRVAKTDRQMDSIYHVLQSVKLTPDAKEKIESQYNSYKIVKDAPESIDFAYEDVNGKTVTLKSLRGKYIYIDVWATWCGPCMMEIPALKKIEEQYKDKNIHFVSLSVDNQRDKQKWKDVVKDKGVKGIQIIADKEMASSFTKTFRINSIPRFILIDPKGKIVSADALRPSQQELKTQLEQLLNPSML